MRVLVVVDDPSQWPLDVPGVEVVRPRTYLDDERLSRPRSSKVFNLCRSYRYQSLGYYVSLLAEGRGHRPIPSIATIQAMKSQSMARLGSDDLDELIQHSLEPLQSDEFVLSIYFGKNFAKRYEKLSLESFNMFQAPLVRARFVRYKSWQLVSVGPIAVADVPEEHWPFIQECAVGYFNRHPAQRRARQPRFDLAILSNPDDSTAPSNKKALAKFERAADRMGFATEFIGHDDYNRVAQFDALFIRETTAVNHPTYRFARRAEHYGAVVIDDPASIVRATNKVYLAEIFRRGRIPTPVTHILHRDNWARALPNLGLPCVLKQPDSSSSRGVVLATTPAEYERETLALLERSDLIVAQGFVPTAFDWRVGTIGGKPLFVCKYFMAPSQWKIIDHLPSGRVEQGSGETLAVEDAPPEVVKLALRAAALIGDGLYGVDIKQTECDLRVIEVNDNPSIDAGIEDRILGDELYRIIIGEFLERIERRTASPTP